MKREIKELIKKAETLDWEVTEDGENEYMFSKFSPAGQDFNIYVEGANTEEIIKDIYSRYESFDVSEEAYLWLDNTGHGANGAPYDMRDLYNDMEACEEMILDLYSTLIKIDFEIIEKHE